MLSTVVALSSGVRAAKLALGLYRALPATDLTMIVNTGDDFDHFGLRICPDPDTALHTLAGINDTEHGWRRRDETWTLMRVMESLGGDTRFRQGDADTAIHVLRAHWLRSGDSLSSMIDEVRARLGISADIPTLTELPVGTMTDTDAGEIACRITSSGAASRRKSARSVSSAPQSRR